jgi:PAS domain S-box-containing protein
MTDPNRPLILIVEDEPATREMLSDLLGDAGYGVVHAANGRAGLARIAAGGIDLVLLDLMLPDLNGWELCREVRAQETATYLPILMLTAMTRPSHQQAGFAAGADDYIGKPFEAENLLNRVEVWIRTSQRLQRQQAALVRQACLLDLAPDGIFVRDLAGRVTYWSAGAEVLYRWSRREAEGRDASQLLRTEFPQPRSEIEATVLRDGLWTGELVQTRRDGSHLRVSSRWALECDEFGRPLAILELNTDVTEREALRAAERRYLDARLEGVLLASRELAQLLNNSLVLPVGVMDVLLTQTNLSPSLRSLVEDAAGALDTAAEQVTQFGKVVRVETRETPLGPSLDLERSVAPAPC